MTAIPIPVGKTFVAWVDEEDAHLVLGRKWRISKCHYGRTVYAQAYEQRGCKSTSVKMHRVILGLAPSDPGVDHHDRDGLNNRRSNLRVATQSQNGANRLKQRNGTGSRFKGVFFRRKANLLRPWEGRITHKRQRRCAFFSTEHEAAMWYNVMARRFFGSFAYLNQIEMG